MMRAKPAMSVIATAAGNTVPPWNRTLRPLPFCASLAAFLVDDELATTGKAIGAIAPSFGEQRPQQAVVGGTDRGRRGLALGPRPTARPHCTGLLRIVDQRPDGSDELVDVVGCYGKAGAGSRQQARDLAVGIDRRHDRPRRRQAGIGLGRNAHVAQPRPQWDDM